MNEWAETLPAEPRQPRPAALVWPAVPSPRRPWELVDWGHDVAPEPRRTPVDWSCGVAPEPRRKAPRNRKE